MSLSEAPPVKITFSTSQDISDEVLSELLSVDKAVWSEETAGIGEFFAKFGDKLPKELASELEGLKSRLA